jgi:hypothetical protein
MPITDELSVTWQGLTFGGSSARQIDGYTIHEEDYERGYFEFSFITTAATDAAFATEIIAIRDAFRDPRGDLVVTQNGSTLLSRKHSDNTALNTFPTITKDGDPADTGRSRHFRARIEYGIPADNVGTSFRRWSTVNVEYDPSGRRIVTISGTYTANSSDGTTGSFAQFLAQLATYAATVTSGIDSGATFEPVGRPSVTRDETDKITDFVAVYKEILANQANGTLNDSAIVDPMLVITRERTAPGDSAGSSVKFGSTGTSLVGGGSGSTVAELPTTPPAGGVALDVQRPTVMTLSYSCIIDSTVTKDLSGKWTSTIRPFLIAQAQAYAGGGVILIDEKPNFGDIYNNRFSAVMVFHTYLTTIISQRVEVSDAVHPGKELRKVWSADPYEYYEFSKGGIRLKTIVETREEQTTETDANKFVERLVNMAPVPQGTGADGKWVVMSRTPKAASLKRGLPGASTVNIAEVTIETTMQYRNKKFPSVANAGGVTGAGLT